MKDERAIGSQGANGGWLEPRTAIVVCSSLIYISPTFDHHVALPPPPSLHPRNSLRLGGNIRATTVALVGSVCTSMFLLSVCFLWLDIHTHTHTHNINIVDGGL